MLAIYDVEISLMSSLKFNIDQLGWDGQYLELTLFWYRELQHLDVTVPIFKPYYTYFLPRKFNAKVEK